MVQYVEIGVGMMALLSSLEVMQEQHLSTLYAFMGYSGSGSNAFNI